LGLPKNLAATDTGNAGNINENVGEKLTVTVTLTTTITTNGVTYRMKSVPSLCTSQQNARRNTITPWNLVESIVAKIGPTNTATFAPENAMVVMVGTQLVGVLARRQTTIVTARDGAMLMLDSVDIMKAA